MYQSPKELLEKRDQTVLLSAYEKQDSLPE